MSELDPKNEQENVEPEKNENDNTAAKVDEDNTSNASPDTPENQESPEQPEETTEKTEKIEKKEKKEKKGKKEDKKKSSDVDGDAVDQTGKKQQKEENPDFKYIVRVANTNLDGNATVPQGLTGIKGIGIRLGITITDKLGLPRTKRMGDLTDNEEEKLVNLVEQLNKEVPPWMVNRRKDFETGEDLHIKSAEIQSVFRDDLNRLKKIRSYRGIRHEQGQKVRGQRTRANGRSGMTVGVMRKKVQQQKKGGK